MILSEAWCMASDLFSYSTSFMMDMPVIPVTPETFIFLLPSKRLV